MKGCQSTQHKVELIHQDETVLIDGHRVPESVAAALHGMVVNVEEQDLQHEAAEKQEPGMAIPAFEQAHEEREDQVELDGEQNIVELIGSVARRHIEEGRLEKGTPGAGVRVDDDIDQTP